MKTLVGMLVGMCLLVPVVYAQDDGVVENAPLNDPAGTVGLARSIIDRLDPSYETIWDIYNGGFSQGVSASLYGFTSNDIHLASLRLGVGTGLSVYSGVGLDLPGLTKRFIPSVLATPASISPLNTLWSIIGKYGRVGVVGGWSWDHDDPVVGVTIGAAYRF